ncbi:response regulator receiver and ANTAR domain protein [Epibacterium ulvae]|uniref:Response regulator receiver and ANTAR domain protein n=1 Tax=Epibacterium ulvae TaxID=1156985 RepID=A0A1G5RAP7_9RHOB|nr:ANTAR domain-containing protein [Epibacterium ulvae]SCZ71154.1 response regulator receiver and ANTAR domain protein [Epibacterium ulvae]
MQTPLSIVVVEPDPARAVAITEALRNEGPHEVLVVSDDAHLARRIQERNPDIVLIDVASPSRDVLEEMALMSGPLERPVAMFVDHSNAGLAKAAISVGVSAYVVDGLRPERLTPIIDAAIARFHMFHQMRAELAATKQALEERKVIDRAKGILMKARGLEEAEAYGMMRKTAMSQGRRLADVAEAIVTTAGLLS